MPAGFSPSSLQRCPPSGSCHPRYASSCISPGFVPLSAAIPARQKDLPTSRCSCTPDFRCIPAHHQRPASSPLRHKKQGPSQWEEPCKKTGKVRWGGAVRGTLFALATTEGGRRPCPLRRRKLRASAATRRTPLSNSSPSSGHIPFRPERPSSSRGSVRRGNARHGDRRPLRDGTARS